MKHIKIFFAISALAGVAFLYGMEGQRVVAPQPQNTYFCVLAGGSGTRLWPVSTPTMPKQLVPFVGGRSLLQTTVTRLAPLVADSSHVSVITNAAQAGAVRAQLEGNVGFVVEEPVGRNTAPAILLAAHRVHAVDPDAVVVVLPSDHFIPDSAAFCAALQVGIEHARGNDHIVLLGLTPTYPATGYGYIQAARAISGTTNVCCPIRAFREKPDAVTAQTYLARGDMLWNLGIFIARARVFLSECQRCAPPLYESFERHVAGELEYGALPSISIDYAVLEQSQNTYVIPVNFEWHDVGNIAVWTSLQRRFGGAEGGDVCHVHVDGDGNLYSPHGADAGKKVVAFVGVSDLCVVETPDALLIVRRDAAERVGGVHRHLPDAFR